MATQSKLFHTEPFLGCYFGRPDTPWDHRYVYRAINMVPYQGIYANRAQDEPIQITSANSTPQWTGFFLKANGQRADLAVVSGEIWQLVAPGGVWGRVVSTANFATASTTISTTARIYACNYNNTMVFSDGVNVPFTWDGSVGAGGIVPLTNAPVAFGAPTVYYGKLFFILASDQRIIRWSEENAANTGYVAGGYLNTWTLGQTAEAGPLYAIRGTNAGLYYWREVGIGVISGAVYTDFSTTGVHDAVDTVVGTNAPGSVSLSGDALWFVDRFGKPYRLPLGGKPEPIWESVADFFIGTDQPGTGQSSALQSVDVALTMSTPLGFYDGVLFALRETGVGTTPALTRGFLFANSGKFYGEMSWGDSAGTVIYPTVVGEAYGQYQSGTATPVTGIRVVMAQQGNLTGVYSYNCPHSTVHWAMTAPVYYLILGPFGDGSALYQWDLFAAGLDVGITDVAPTGTTVTLALNSTERLGSPDSAQANSATITESQTVHQDKRVAWGIAREARFLQAKIGFTVNAAHGQWGFRRIDVSAFPVPADPAQP